MFKEMLRNMLNREETPYARMGGEPVVRALVDRFYDLMDTLDDTKPLRDLHPADLTESREKLFWFMSGWLGGPQLFVEKRGHPMLRRRHFPFAVDTAMRDQWMHCMSQALKEHVSDEELRAKLESALAALADHMRNREG